MFVLDTRSVVQPPTLELRRVVAPLKASKSLHVFMYAVIFN